MNAAIAWTLGIALAVSSAVVAEEPKLEEIDPAEKPKDYKAGQSTRYAIWRDDNGWHFRYTTSSDSVQHFSGAIRVVGGRMTSITPRGTPARGVKTGADAEPKKVTAPAYNFDMKINRGIEAGIDFTLDDKATALTFELKVNGKSVPALIYIGAKGTHPKEGTFQLPAKPQK
jgi:hypothetical protein